MKKIVITQPVGLTERQLAELDTLGEVASFDTISKNTAEWLGRVEGADIIYTNIFGFEEGWKSLRDVFVTVPFVGVSFLDPKTLKERNVTVSRSPGCNRIAVAEWVAGMMLNYARQLPAFVKTTHFDEPTPFYTTSLYAKVVCLLGGKGFIGRQTGSVLEGLGMRVEYFNRGDDLVSKIKDADYIVDCLSLNPSTLNFYNETFFDNAKDGVVFITVSSRKLKDNDAILRMLAQGKIAHYITDNAQAMLFDAEDEEYRALLGNPNVTITPHIAAYSDNTRATATRMCIENIKAYIADKPINCV